jgi:hypothetical protein
MDAVFLLAMMIIVGILPRTGEFEFLAGRRLHRLHRPRLFHVELAVVTLLKPNAGASRAIHISAMLSGWSTTSPAGQR